MATDMRPKAWHWQERLGAGDAPDEACRRQLHQIRERISYRAWLKQKSRNRARRAGTESHAENDEDDDTTKREKSEAAFREWRARKNRELCKKKKKKGQLQPQHPVVTEAPGKPPSQHVNPKVKRTKQTPVCLARPGGRSPKKQSQQSQVEAAAAYEAWLARVRLEDRVRRSQRRQERAAQAQQAHEAHATKWKKKLVVCAYSTAAAT